MKPGANLLQFGEHLAEEMKLIVGDLPVGVGVHLVADQPVVVEEAVSGFTRALFEAVAIVLARQFRQPRAARRAGGGARHPAGARHHLLAMDYLGITLQRISLGALIIALGLLVDDAMIAVEMMVSRLEVGDSLRKAATYVYTSTAAAMLTGTLVTVAGFIPIGLNDSSGRRIHVHALRGHRGVADRLVDRGGAVHAAARRDHPAGDDETAPCGAGAIHAHVQCRLFVAVRHYWVTIVATVLLFGLSLFGMGFVQQQFFPGSDRPELIVDFNLPQNASIEDTRAQIERFEDRRLRGDEDIEHWSTYIGQGAGRFVLSFDVQQPNPYYGQVVIVTKGYDVRHRVQEKLEKILRDEFVGTDTLVKALGARAAGRTAGSISPERSGYTDSCARWRSTLPASSTSTRI
jgi:multidrug efflux pump subunit AcrB